MRLSSLRSKIWKIWGSSSMKIARNYKVKLTRRLGKSRGRGGFTKMHAGTRKQLSFSFDLFFICRRKKRLRKNMPDFLLICSPPASGWSDYVKVFGVLIWRRFGSRREKMSLEGTCILKRQREVITIPSGSITNCVDPRKLWARCGPRRGKTMRSEKSRFSLKMCRQVVNIQCISEQKSEWYTFTLEWPKNT